jgi:hypothetical protein
MPALSERVRDVESGLVTLLAEAEAARAARAEVRAAAGAGTDMVAAGDSPSGSAVCAWNHFENIPTFYNWNNRPR